MNESNRSILDNPVWTALAGRQAHLSLGQALARRYHPDVAPFAAVAEPTHEAYQSLHRLLTADAPVSLMSPEPIGPVDGLTLTAIGSIHQMLAVPGKAHGAEDAMPIIRLNDGDKADMLALVHKTKPGPFGTRTIEMGDYIGIRYAGQLIAMAGERMRLDGHTEISAVCVDPDFRGKGLAGALIEVLRGRIAQRGETAFLHVFATNASAIRLYEHLGFTLRRAFHLTHVRRSGTSDAAVS